MCVCFSVCCRVLYEQDSIKSWSTAWSPGQDFGLDKHRRRMSFVCFSPTTNNRLPCDYTMYIFIYLTSTIDCAQQNIIVFIRVVECIYECISEYINVCDSVYVCV